MTDEYEPGVFDAICEILPKVTAKPSGAAWTDYRDHRLAVVEAWKRGTSDPDWDFEEDSPMDELSNGCFMLGWELAMRCAEKALGVKAGVLDYAISGDGLGVVRLSERRLRALREVPRMEPNPGHDAWMDAERKCRVALGVARNDEP